MVTPVPVTQCTPALSPFQIICYAMKLTDVYRGYFNSFILLSSRLTHTSTMSEKLGVSRHPHSEICYAPPVLKKQISKNTDPLLLPYLKEGLN